MVSCFLYLLSCASGNVGGVRVVVHTAGTAPNVVESGFDVQLGTSVSVAMTGKKFKTWTTTRQVSPKLVCRPISKGKF